MFKWLSQLFRRSAAAFHGRPPAELPTGSFPTSETISDWDDQGLYVATGCEAAIRFHNHGFETLNDAERALCCFYLMESCINNGGVGQWIDNLCPLSAAETPRILQSVGATEMAAFVTDALRPLGDPEAIPSQSAWIDHYMSMSDDVHEKWESLTPQYCALEDRFLELAYAYARKHWEQVRAASIG